MPSPAACPASSSRRMTSCSGPLSSRGGRVAAQGRRLAQDAEPERLVGAGQRLGRGAAEPRGDPLAQVARRRPGTPTAAGTRRATGRRGGPGRRPPRRPSWSCRCRARRAPAARRRGASTAACWRSSRTGASATRPGARRRVSTQEFHHTPPTAPPAQPVPSQRARRQVDPAAAERAADQRRALRPPVGQRLVLQPRGRVTHRPGRRATRSWRRRTRTSPGRPGAAPWRPPSRRRRRRSGPSPRGSASTTSRTASS